MEDSTKVVVKNRLNIPIIYYIPDMSNLRRQFQGRQEKTLTFEELRKLSYVPGGETIIKDYLIIKDKEAIQELNLNIQPEYFYEKEQIVQLLKNGSMDQFLDCLDFAPSGVIQLLKNCAVELPLNDVAKREVLLEKLDFNVAKTIEIRKVTSQSESKTTEKTSTRRVAEKENGQQKKPSTGRRVIKKEK